MRKWLMGVVVLTGCSSKPPAVSEPPRPGSASPAAAAPAELDSGTLVTTKGGKVVTQETFSLRQVGDHRVLRASSVNVEDPKNNLVDGELEFDGAGRPVRAAYRMVTPAEGYEYRLGGSPLTLDVTRDDKRDPQHVVAEGPVDVFVTGPGLAALTPLCKVSGDAVLSTVGVEDATWPHHVEAYRAAPVSALHRIVVDTSDFDFELVCEGDRLIAGGIGAVDYWFVRAGREPDLTALKAAPRPPKHAWTHPVVASEPWDPLQTYQTGRVIVTRDQRKRMNRLTAYDLVTGAQVAQRDFATPVGAHVMCEPLPRDRLICLNKELRLLRILDATTLVDQEDLAPLLLAQVPEAATADDWSMRGTNGAAVRIALLYDIKDWAEIDLAARTVRRIQESTPWKPAPSSPNLCERNLSDDGIKVGRETWAITRTETGHALARKGGATVKPPLALPFSSPFLLTCPAAGGGPYMITYNEAQSVLARMKPDGRVAWTAELGAHPVNVEVSGARLIVSTASGARRVVAVEAATGAIAWVAKGPLPTK